MLYQLTPKTSESETPDDDVTLTFPEIATALFPALIGMAVMGLVVVLMLV